MTKRCLPDVNVWFALAVEEHEHHALARVWWESMSGVCGFVPVTQLGFLRLLTSAGPMRGKPLSNDEAWTVFDAFLADDRVRLFPELSSLDANFVPCRVARSHHPRSGWMPISPRTRLRTRPFWSPLTRRSPAMAWNAGF